MSERFTLDRPSFEQVLCATSLIQQLNKRVQANSAPDLGDTKPLSELVETQLAIETGTIDLEAAMSRVVGLAVQLSPATGAAIWLFTGDEFVYRAGTEGAAQDKRLKLEVLSKLAAMCGRNGHSPLEVGPASDSGPAYDAIHYPGSIKSLLVAPIYRDRDIAGTLAVFSTKFSAFAERDATSARLLSGLLTHSLRKAAEVELKQSVSLERAAMLQVIDRLIPALEKLAEEGRLKFQASADECPSLSIELEPESAAVPGQVLEGSPVEITDIVRDGGEAGLTVEMMADDSPEVNAGDSGLPAPEAQMGEVVAESAPAVFVMVPVNAQEPTPDRPSATIVGLRSDVQSFATTIGNSLQGAAITILKATQTRLIRARCWLSNTTTKIQRGFPGRVARYQSLIPVLPRLKLKVRVQYGVAVPAAGLMLMLIFLLWRTTASFPSKAEGATSEGNATPAATGSVTEGSHQLSSAGPTAPLSHLRVTDSASSSTLQTLSRYEIAGLRRRAQYGDDAAALVLGMAYERGQLVPQNCVKAREWIARSANEGNAAAQYNLGLRYLQGDGVPADQEVAMKWLARSAARKYPQALALQSAP